MIEGNFRDWKNFVVLNNKKFIPNHIREALIFLQKNRNKEGAWGNYVFLPTNIHISSLAIKALRICNETQFEATAEDAALGLKSIITENINQLMLLELIDSLNIISGIKSRDYELENKIISRIKEIGHEYLIKPGFSLSLISELILELSKFEDINNEFIAKQINLLIESQDSVNGGWGATIESKSDIIPTCKVLSALNLFPKKITKKSYDIAFEYLVKHLRNVKRETSFDTFAVSVILRTLGEIENSPFDIVQNYVNILNERQNIDYGWGAQKGEESDIELTSLVIIALISCGENKFIPFNLVKASFEKADFEITDLRNEKTMFLADVDQRVNEEIPNVIKDRNRLAEEINTYKYVKDELESQLEGSESHIKKLESINQNSKITIKSLLAEKDKLIAENKEIKAQLRTRELDEKESDLNKKGRYDTVVGIAAFFCITIFMYPFVSLFITKLGLNATDLQGMPLNLFASMISLAISIGIFYRIGLKQNKNLNNLNNLNEIKKENYTNNYYYLSNKLNIISDSWPLSKREDFLFYLRKTSDISVEDKEDISLLLDYVKSKYGENQAEKRELEDFLLLYIHTPVSERFSIIDDIKESINYEKKY